MARYWLATWVQDAHGGAFPFGTLAVNILGSFALGLLMTLALEREIVSPELRLLLGVGFCGGFTTMSTFSHETMALMQNGNAAAGLANIGLSLAACLAGVWLGSVTARAFW